MLKSSVECGDSHYRSNGYPVKPELSQSCSKFQYHSVYTVAPYRPRRRAGIRCVLPNAVAI